MSSTVGHLPCSFHSIGSPPPMECSGSYHLPRRVQAINVSVINFVEGQLDKCKAPPARLLESHGRN
jgi:hypothetical protein